MGKLTEAINAFMGVVSGTQWREELTKIFPSAVDQAEANASHMFQSEIQGVENYRLIKEKVQQTKQPILIMLSEDFGPFASYLPSLQQWLSQTEVITISDANHNLPWKQPHQIAREVNRFISSMH